jgi:serine/threonine protein kinase
MNNCPRDGSPLTQTGQALGGKVDPTFEDKYEFIGTIGSGGMGVIYKARHLVLNRVVAVKMLHTNLASPDAVQRFQAEGKTSSLLSHPNIVKVHDLGVTASGQPYMVMDYVEGRTLDQILKSGPLEKGAFLRIFSQLCSALAHAHRKSVLHRDIKPGNIMISGGKSEEEVHILDFGIAKILTDTTNGAAQLTKTGEAIGSPIYMSPEQSQGTKLDHRSDLYSLGCVVYECICGEPPLLGKNALETMMMHSEEKPRRLREMLKGKKVDPVQEKIVMRLLEKKPEHRFQSAEDIVKELARVQESGGLLYSVRNSFAELVETCKRRKDLIFACVVVVTVIGAVAVGWMIHSMGQKQNSKTALESILVSEDDIILASTSKQELQSLLQGIVKQNPPRTELNLPAKITMVIGPDELAILKDARSLKSLNLRLAFKIDDSALEKIDNLTLEKLNISSTGIKDLHALRNMPTLRALDCSNTHINLAGTEVIGHLTNLETLKLENTSLKDDALKNLYGLSKLKSLDLASTLFSEGAVAELRRKLPGATVVFSSKTPQWKKEIVETKERARYDMTHQRWKEAISALDAGISAFSEAPLGEREPYLGTIAEMQDMRGESLTWLKKFADALKAYDHGIESATSARASMLLAQLRFHKARVLGLQIAEMQLSGANPKLIKATTTDAIREHEAVSSLLERLPADAEEKQHGAELLLDNQLQAASMYLRQSQPENAARELTYALTSIRKQQTKEKVAFWTADMIILGDWYLDAKNYKQALEIYQQARQFSAQSTAPALLPYEAQIQFKRGATYFASGNYKEADKCFTDLLPKPAFDRNTKIGYLKLIIRMFESKGMTERANFYKEALAHV